MYDATPLQQHIDCERPHLHHFSNFLVEGRMESWFTNSWRRFLLVALDDWG